MKKIVFPKKLLINFGMIEITQIFIFTFLIIFMIFPIFTYLYERMMFNYLENTLINYLETSVVYVYLDLNKTKISEEGVEEKDKFERFRENVEESLKSKKIPMLKDLSVIYIKINNKYIEVYLKIELTPLLYRKIFMELSNKKNYKKDLKLNVNLPINN